MPYETITVHELMERSAQSIENTPLNYTQHRYATNARMCFEKEEACGTAFCRAGWMMAHVDPPRSTSEWTTSDMYTGIERRSIKLLRDCGIPLGDIIKLFQSTALEEETKGSILWCDGSETVAKAGAAGMRKFMQTHEAKLKAHTVEVWKDEGNE